jgi:hypothetical protein
MSKGNYINAECHRFYSSPVISRVVIPRMARVVQREMGRAYKVSPENLRRRGHLGILRVDRKFEARDSVVG